MSCLNCGGVGCANCWGLNTSACYPSSSCSTPRSSGSCGCPLPATPAPFYANTPSCVESHCQIVNNQYFAVAICTAYAFNMPACDETALVYFPNVKVLPVGTNLWSQPYGYLEVIAFDSVSGAATLRNNCEPDNAAAGTPVPACTCFTVGPTPPPLDLASVTAVDMSEGVDGNINSIAASIDTGEIEAVFSNPSGDTVMNVVIDFIAYGGFEPAAAVTLNYEILINLDNAGYSIALGRIIRAPAVTGGEHLYSLYYSYETTVAPGASLSIKSMGRMTHTAGVGNVTVNSFSISHSGIGVAV